MATLPPLPCAPPAEPAVPIVWACVVCYHPEPQKLRRLLDALRPQVRQIALIDNTPQPSGLAAWADGTVQHHPMHRNAGTAGGLNQAWELALSGQADYLVSFDQDSEPEPHMVQRLLASLQALAAQGRRVAAVGPTWIDSRTRRPMRLLRPVAWRRRHCQPGSAPVEVDHLITSGCLTPASTYRALGPFREDLFLDYVDIEWCLRARAQGYALFADPSTSMEHAIGERVLQIAGRSMALHQPARNYLLLRNHLLLWRTPGIPLGWLVADARQVALKAVFSVLMAPPRWQRLRALARGLRDGLRGRGGPLP